jgi:hypothetical protein
MYPTLGPPTPGGRATSVERSVLFGAVSLLFWHGVLEFSQGQVPRASCSGQLPVRASLGLLCAEYGNEAERT